MAKRTTQSDARRNLFRATLARFAGRGESRKAFHDVCERHRQLVGSSQSESGSRKISQDLTLPNAADFCPDLARPQAR